MIGVDCDNGGRTGADLLQRLGQECSIADAKRDGYIERAAILARDGIIEFAIAIEIAGRQRLWVVENPAIGSRGIADGWCELRCTAAEKNRHGGRVIVCGNHVGTTIMIEVGDHHAGGLVAGR